MDPLPLTRALVALDTPTGAEAAATDLMHGTLVQLGWQVQRQVVLPGRDNLYAWREPPELVFSTHLDCVPPYVPLREDGDKLWGRGSCDAKGLAAAMVAAAERLAALGERRIGLLFVVGEEDGSEGALAAAALEPKGRFLINGEPTEGRLVVGQKGALRVVVTASGRAAHSGYPDEGTSALLPLLDTLERIRHLPLPVDPVLGPATLNIGTLRAGSAPNVIPAEASAQILVRTVGPSAALREAIAACATPGVEIAFTLEIPAYRAEGQLPSGWETTVVSYGSDLPFFSDWGVGFQLGPGTIRVAHTEEEHISKAELMTGVDQYVSLAQALLASIDGEAA
ncbi:MAG: M20/M25/M40 family metallo-hydrolase [Gemmatimonadota bacterium]|nr:M20/M25/M40 family metallo-hydrolase [Gemmatimonadota bacterium]